MNFTCVIPFNVSESFEAGDRLLADDIMAYKCPESAILVAMLDAYMSTKVRSLSKLVRFGLQ